MKTPRLIYHPVDIGEPDDVMAEPDGIRLGYPGDRAARRLDYATTARWLEQERLDDRPDLGIHLAMALVIATEEGWYTPPEGDTRALWCWISVAVFFLEQLQEGNVVRVCSPDGYLVPAIVDPSGPEMVNLTQAMLRMQVTCTAELAVRLSVPGWMDYRPFAVRSYKSLLMRHPGTDEFCLSAPGRRRFTVFQELAAFAVLNDRDTSLHRLLH